MSAFNPNESGILESSIQPVFYNLEVLGGNDELAKQSVSSFIQAGARHS